MDICVEKKKQFFKTLYKAIKGENSLSIIELIGKIAIFYKKKFNINQNRIAILKSLGSNGFGIVKKQISYT